MMHKRWRKKLSLTQLPLFKSLTDTLDEFSNPHKSLVFRAFDLTYPQDVKAVIVGDAPISVPKMSNGLAFSIAPHIKHWPKSTHVIFKEYSDDLKYPTPKTGDLSSWASNGVLLLNSRLTSNSNPGWEKLTYHVLKWINDNRSHIVFIFWGKEAQQYKALVDTNKHLTIIASYPNMLNETMQIRSNFLGHSPFTTTNDYLKEHDLKPIDWRLR